MSCYVKSIWGEGLWRGEGTHNHTIRLQASTSAPTMMVLPPVRGGGRGG